MVVISLAILAEAAWIGIVAVKAWRDPAVDVDDFRFIPVPQRLGWRSRDAFTRGMATLAADFAFLGGFCVVAATQMSGSGRMDFSATAHIVAGVMLLGYLVTVVVTLAIWLFNVPKFLVPAHRRAEPGQVQDWFARSIRKHGR